MMQREEKQIDISVEAIVTKLSDLKNQLHALLFKIEHENESLTWPNILDNFLLISGQFTAISKMLAPDKTPPLRNLTVLPLLLSQDKDEELLQLTERRIPAFSHEIVPDYLRTKLDPDIDMKIQQFQNKAAQLANEPSQKQITAFTKVLNHVLDTINKSREEWESEAGSRGGIGQSSSIPDTHTLVSVVSMGKGLKQMTPPGPSGPPGMMVPPGAVRPGSVGPGPPPPPGSQGSPMNPNPGQMGMMGKAQAGIKTNIKSAAMYR
ncbi:mediator of RNA polymerase II transcription subunit 8 [Planococcus citri]|uniref:mediator of RNA polymerase II transcription subunit 8 n=1 Tax=Planococcus citri TaxID=170843 RepID=UPI0031F8BDE5